MKSFWSTFFAVLLAGGVLAGGALWLQRRSLQNDRRAFAASVKANEARDALQTWILEAKSQAETIERKGAWDVAPFCKAYTSAIGWLAHVPEAERPPRLAELQAARDQVLSRIQPGTPQWDDVKKATES